MHGYSQIQMRGFKNRAASFFFSIQLVTALIDDNGITGFRHLSPTRALLNVSSFLTHHASLR